MTLSRSVSRAILLTFTCVLTVPLHAQDRFDVDDVSAFTGYRGYSTYRGQEQQLQNPATDDRYQPQPILTQQFIQSQ